MGMGRPRLWTEESVLTEALKYQTPYEFQLGNKKAYSFAHRFGFLPKVTAHMQRQMQYSPESVQAEALKYSNRADFDINSHSHYGWAHRNNLLDKICSHMGEAWPSEWTEDKILQEALKYKNRTEFQDNAKTAYDRARKLEILDIACSHMKRVASLKETALLDYLKTLKEDFKLKRFGRDFEIDCYSESLKLGIEFNGLYWHNEAALNRSGQSGINYHLNKTKYFENLGIRIIHIWEHEWNDRPEQVKDYLKSACGLNSIKIGARKCVFKEIDSSDARKFLSETHIQGAPNIIKYAIGCFHKGILIGVCCFGPHHRQKEINVLNRFACLADHTVMGFLSKASQMAFDHFKGPMISWADYSKSQAKGYISAGWKIDAMLRPDYFYYDPKTKSVKSKQSRKKQAVKTPVSMTESQHAALDGLLKVYDCGKIRLSFSV